MKRLKQIEAVLLDVRMAHILVDRGGSIDVFLVFFPVEKGIFIDLLHFFEILFGDWEEMCTFAAVLVKASCLAGTSTRSFRAPFYFYMHSIFVLNTSSIETVKTPSTSTF